MHLFTSDGSAEIRKHARYEWQPSEHGGYDLEVKDELSITINPSLIGLWRIFGYAGRSSIRERQLTLPEAFRNAEQFVDLMLKEQTIESLKQRRRQQAA